MGEPQMKRGRALHTPGPEKAEKPVARCADGLGRERPNATREHSRDCPKPKRARWRAPRKAPAEHPLPVSCAARGALGTLKATRAGSRGSYREPGIISHDSWGLSRVPTPPPPPTFPLSDRKLICLTHLLSIVPFPPLSLFPPGIGKGFPRTHTRVGREYG